MPDPIGFVTLPVYALGERAYTGFRQNMLDAGPHSVSTGGGLGSDAIWIELDDGKGAMSYRYVHGRDVLAAVAALVKHPDADRIPTTPGFRS